MKSKKNIKTKKHPKNTMEVLRGQEANLEKYDASPQTTRSQPGIEQSFL